MLIKTHNNNYLRSDSSFLTASSAIGIRRWTIPHIDCLTPAALTEQEGVEEEDEEEEAMEGADERREGPTTSLSDFFLLPAKDSAAPIYPASLYSSLETESFTEFNNLRSKIGSFEGAFDFFANAAL